MKNENLQLELFYFSDYKEKQANYNDLKQAGIKHIAMQIDNVEEKYNFLKDKGIDIDKPVKGTICMMFCFLRCPDGFINRVISRILIIILKHNFINIQIFF